MAQKINPYIFRLGVNKTWHVKWFARKKKFTEFLNKDNKLLALLAKKLKDMSVSSVDIERTDGGVTVFVHSGKPGLLIGKQGATLEELKVYLSQNSGEPTDVRIIEVKQPETDAVIVGDTIARQIEKRIHFKRAMKQAVQKAMEKGALGIKVKISGRLGGTEIARSEFIAEGRIPLHTIRADIDFAIAEANTDTGKLGIKIWIFKGMIFKKKDPAGRDTSPSNEKSNDNMEKVERAVRKPLPRATVRK